MARAVQSDGNPPAILPNKSKQVTLSLLSQHRHWLKIILVRYVIEFRSDCLIAEGEE